MLAANGLTHRPAWFWIHATCAVVTLEKPNSS